MAYDFKLITVAIEDGVATATIDAPPINVMTIEMWGELDRLSLEIKADDAVRVLILKSANPDFFIAHADVSGLEAKGQATDLEPAQILARASGND